LLAYGEVVFQEECVGVWRYSSDFSDHGAVAGGDVYSPAMTDFIYMVRDTSYMFRDPFPMW